MKIFLTGYIQVVLVAINSWQIAHEKIIGAFIVGFLISLVWCLNVKKIATGGWKERIIYCLGAAVGSASSLLIVKVIYK